MISFTVINPDVVVERDIPKEVKIERALDVYNRALLLLQNKRRAEAQAALEDILARDVLRERLPAASKGAHSSRLHALQYVVHLNYGGLLELQGEWAAAHQHYQKATLVDASDAALWCKLGRTAMRLRRWDAACAAYYDGLQRTEIRALKTQCYEGVVDALYEMGELATCLDYIKKALKNDPAWERGNVLKRHIVADYAKGFSLISLQADEVSMEDIVEYQTGVPQQADSMLQSRNPVPSGSANYSQAPRTLHVKDLTWESLGNELIDVYGGLIGSSDRTPNSQDGWQLRQLRFEYDYMVKGPSTEIPNSQNGTHPANGVDEGADAVMEYAEPDVADDGMGDPIQPDNEKKRQLPEADDSRRVSKRVRHRLEQEQQQKTTVDVDLEALIDRCLPNGCSVRCCMPSVALGKAQMFLDMEVYLSEFCARMLAAPVPNDVNRRSKGKRDLPRSLPMRGPHSHSSDEQTRQDVANFIEMSTSKNSGILDVIARFVLHLLSELCDGDALEKDPQPLRSPALQSIIGVMLVILQKHDAWNTFLRSEDAPVFGLTETADKVAPNLGSTKAPDWEIEDRRRRVFEIILLSCEILCSQWLDGSTTSVERFADNEEDLLPMDGDDSVSNPIHGISVPLALRKILDSLHEILESGGESIGLAANLRYLWVHGRINEGSGDHSQAFKSYADCREKLLHAHPRVDAPVRKVVIPHCPLDGVISLDTLSRKSFAWDVHRHIVDVRKHFAEGDYTRSAMLLSRVFLQSLSGEGLEGDFEIDERELRIMSKAREVVIRDYTFKQRLELLKIFRESCDKLGLAQHSFVGAVQMLLEGLYHPPGEDDDFENCLEMLARSLHHCITFMQSSSADTNDWTRLLRGYPPHGLRPSGTLYDQFVSAIFVAMRMTCAYLKHYQDIPSQTRRITITRRIAALKLFSLRSWVAAYYVSFSLQRDESRKSTTRHNSPVPNGRHTVNGSENTEVSAVSETAHEENRGTEFNGDLLSVAHTELGRRSMCGADDGLLLQTILRNRATTNDEALRAELQQCYYCLYGIKFDHGAILTEHSAAPRPFDEAAASNVFDAIADTMLQKLNVRNSRGITGDLKECLDKVAKVFPSPPWKNARVFLNREYIDRLLEEPIDIAQFAPGRIRSDTIPAFTSEERSKVSHVHFNIFFLQAKLALTQYRSRAQSYTDTHRSISILKDTVAPHFLFDLYMNPHRFESWLLLGICYSALINEHLAGSAALIVDASDGILEWQRRAFHCFVQAYRLVDEAPNNHTVVTLWSDLGFLCYGIASKPMHGVAAYSKAQKIRELWFRRCAGSERAEEPQQEPNGTGPVDEAEEADILEGTVAAMTGLAAYCFRKVQRMDTTDWKFPFMLATLYAKQRRPPKDVIGLYLRSMRLVPRDWTTKDQENILDPVVKLLGYLCKTLFARRIEPQAALAAISKIWADVYPRFPQLQRTIPSDERYVNGDDEAGAARLMAIDRIYEALDRLRPLNAYQHKPVFRMAWIQYRVHRNPARAKDILSNLFRLDDKQRKFVHFWKPEFERPGKHFMSIHKYTLFMIKLCVELNDIDGLRSLCKKFTKVEEVLLWPDKLWQVAFEGGLRVIRQTFSINGNASSLLPETLSKEAFDRRAPEVERLILTAENRPAGLQQLLWGVELEDLNKGKMDTKELRVLMASIYSSIFLDAAHSIPEATTQPGPDTLAADSSTNGLDVPMDDATAPPQASVPVRLEDILMRCRKLPTM
ncbi:uncharacterized protein EV422DRAFT_153906 [Fimicolochytrium jonesii]|uniref:uncharacterized protein n=1 Tax=Fimicolochytrium jonesii TaxID=1396493 RepID=UPI0022FE90A6|nr:uncharacterized protein EV422DRAFT_153906 [Fimicolochytrium jonesii]KAI8826104.1 hypothetical protein EV422DRAFT_153906 [Fimicolochytrium jonesii]